MRADLLVFSLVLLIILASIGCTENALSRKEEIVTSLPSPAIIEQKSLIPHETKPLDINLTFETWSRGYWSNLSYYQSYFRVITNYSAWNAFLDEQGYPGRLEGELYPGYAKNFITRKIEHDDFDRHFIIAAMMGHRSKQEPEIEIKTISRLDSVVNVSVHIYESSIGNLVESAPYHIVIIKRELLPKGNSTFNFMDTEGKELGKVDIRD